MTGAIPLDMARRGAVEEARQFCHELEALAVSEHRKLSSNGPLSFFEAHMREQRAQSAREEAEAALAHEQTPATIEAFLAASSEHRSAIEVLDDVVRAMRENV